MNSRFSNIASELLYLIMIIPFFLTMVALVVMMMVLMAVIMLSEWLFDSTISVMNMLLRHRKL